MEVVTAATLSRVDSGSSGRAGVVVFSAALCAILSSNLLACRALPPSPSAGAFENDDVAIVASDRVSLTTVDRIAGKQGLRRHDAVNVAIRDAVFGAAGRERLGQFALTGIERSASARTLLEHVVLSAKGMGPPTAPELTEAAQARWWEFDRPPMRRVTHAVAMASKSEEEPKARALAERILASVKHASDAAAFKRLASEASAEEQPVRVEDLDPVTADGRALDPEAPHPPGFVAASFDPDFVRAAFAIDAPLHTSPIVKTRFGYHVIFLVEEVPERRVPLEGLRTQLAQVVIDHRSKVLFEELKETVRKKTPIEVDRAASELTATLRVVP